MRHFNTQIVRERLGAFLGVAGWLSFGAGLELGNLAYIGLGLLVLLVAIFLLNAHEPLWWWLIGLLLAGTTLFVYFPDIIAAAGR